MNRTHISPPTPLRAFWLSLALCALMSLALSISLPETLQAKGQRKARAAKVLEADEPISTHLLPALSEQQRAQLKSLRADPEPEALVRNSHYWVSNEHNHQVWYESIKGVGGAFVGVGTDQNYLLAGWTRPELLILMDFDGEIARLHEMYEFFFSISSSPKTFHLRWHRSYAEDSKAKLKAYFEERIAMLQPSLSERERARQLKQRLKVYTLTRGLIYRRLARTIKKYKKLKLPTFMTEQAQFDYLRSLWAQGRVVAIRGDLTADHTMLDISHTLKQLGVTLNTLYLSNAEQYFDLIPTYRRNIIELPWGEQSYALRTLGWRAWGFIDEDEKYHYNLQGGLNFRAWMERGRVTKAGRMLRHRTKTEPFGTSILDRAPVEGKKAPKIAPVPTRP